MNNHEQAKLSRNAGLGKFLSDNAATYAADNAFKALVKKFNTDAAAAADAATATGADNSGFSADKLKAKTDAAHSAAALSAAAQVQLESLGKLALAQSLHDAEAYYTSTADAESIARLKAAHKLMSDNQAIITDDYVTLAELATLQDLIDTFSTTQGSSEAAHAVSPAATAAFKSALSTVGKDVKNILKLAKKYKRTNSDFYNSLVAACELPAIAIRHTTFDATIHDAVTGSPIAGATGTLSNSKTTATTDDSGFFHIDHIGAGNPTITIQASGYKTYSAHVHIVSGTENSVTILLEKV